VESNLRNKLAIHTILTTKIIRMKASSLDADDDWKSHLIFDEDYEF
jgi:hypothetical protein